MHFKKTEACLFIYHLLLKKRKLSRNEILADYEISEISFKRYIREIKDFLHDANLPYKIHYSRHEEVYILLDDDC